MKQENIQGREIIAVDIHLHLPFTFPYRLIASKEDVQRLVVGARFGERGPGQRYFLRMR